MPTFEDARRIILSSVGPLKVDYVDILESVGMAIAEDLIAPWDTPRYDNSAMDGYAVRAADCKQSEILRVTGYVAAGEQPSVEVEAGCAVKIMTGAPIPSKCDAVVPFEETDESEGQVRIKQPVTAGQHIRRTGEDVARGEVIVTAGTLLRPPEINILASFGKESVPVYSRPRVAILSTGDELIQPGEPLLPGKIINSNSFSIAAAVLETGAIPVIIGIARDNVESHRRRICEGLEADVLITSAGVSAGDRDLVRDVLREVGVQQVFWRVDVKPGGPTAFGLKDGKPVFSLPGNPVSTMVIFEELVRPALLKMLGHRRVIKPFVSAVLQHEVQKKPGKIHFLRVRLTRENGKFLASSSGDQNTGILKTMLMADAIALLPADRTSFSAGETLDVHIVNPKVEMLEA